MFRLFLKQLEIRSSARNHFDMLDGLRGLAILMVVIFHTFYVNPNAGIVTTSLGQLIGAGRMGVQIFFVISGFLISYTFFCHIQNNSKHFSIGGYAWRRAGKIIPPFYLSIVIFASFYMVYFRDAKYGLVGLYWALGIPNFFPVSTYFNASYWSLIVEAQFYCVLPLLFFLCRGLNLRSTTLAIFGILLIVPFVVRQITWLSLENGQVASRDSILFLMSRFPNAMDFFAWGILFAGYFTHKQKASINTDCKLSVLGYWGLALLVFSLVITAACDAAFGFYDQPQMWNIELFHLLPSLSAFLMLFFIFDSQCLGARFFAQSWLRLIGVVSFEWFLFHLPFIVYFRNFFGQAHGSVLRYLCITIVPLVLTFFISIIIYRFFSLPILRRIRQELKA